MYCDYMFRARNKFEIYRSAGRVGATTFLYPLVVPLRLEFYSVIVEFNLTYFSLAVFCGFPL